jgi:hypothetical protein
MRTFIRNVVARFARGLTKGDALHALHAAAAAATAAAASCAYEFYPDCSHEQLMADLLMVPELSLALVTRDRP